MREENKCWQKGVINKEREYVKLLRAEDKTLICFLQSSGDNSFIVELKDGVDSHYIKEAEKELDYYLIELNEPDPWKYAKYHCSTTANLYSKVAWVLIKGTTKDEF